MPVFRPNPEKLQAITGVMHRILASGRQPVFSKEDYLMAKAFLAAHPEEDEVLIFPGGKMFGGREHAKLTRTRALQVCFAQSYGWFPMVLGRVTTELWELV